MDPRACLRRAYDAMVGRDWEELCEAVGDYWRWRDRGGYEPPSGDLIAYLIESAYLSADLEYLTRMGEVLGRYLGTE